MKRQNGVSILLILMSFIYQNAIYSQQGRKSLKETKPNVIVFIADDVSWDDFGCYGNTIVRTPNIDDLASNGVRFNNAFLTTSSCSPSRISIMTGRYPHNTGAAELHTEPKVTFESIGSRLKAQGYYTGQAGKWHMGNLLKGGFDTIHDIGSENGDGGEDMWIPALQNRDKNKPFFFWFASIDAHRPWGPNEFSKTHDPAKTKVPMTLYDDDSTKIDLSKYYDEIKRFDYNIGEVVNELKKQNVLDKTIIIVMADNGRPFPRDKTRMYDSGLKTPFIVFWPKNIKKGNVTNSLISSVDIAPTILDVCGAESPESFQGKSFKSVLLDPKTPFRTYVFGEHNWHDHEAHERMVRTKDYLYILNSRPQFPNQGPVDVIKGPSFRALEARRNKNELTRAQSDLFLAPRPSEELYLRSSDHLQLDNLVGKSEYESIHNDLKHVLMEWMNQTGDNVPENLTHDWYTRDTGNKIKQNFNIRGEMPGKTKKADLLNKKGKF